MKVALTDKFCAAAKPGEWFDEKANGLALLVGKTRKTWQLNYSQSGKRRRLSLGHYPSMSLAAARARAVEGKDKAEAGQPMKANNVAAMLDEFHSRYAQDLRSADYVK